MALFRKRPTVTAGLRWAPLNGPATTTPTKTAMAHAQVMTIQPLALALDLARSTPATTPSPRRIRSIVPKISANRTSVFMLSPSGMGYAPFARRATQRRRSTEDPASEHPVSGSPGRAQHDLLGCVPPVLSRPRPLAARPSGRGRRTVPAGTVAERLRPGTCRKRQEIVQIRPAGERGDSRSRPRRGPRRRRPAPAAGSRWTRRPDPGDRRTLAEVAGAAFGGHERDRGRAAPASAAPAARTAAPARSEPASSAAWKASRGGHQGVEHGLLADGGPTECADRVDRRPERGCRPHFTPGRRGGPGSASLPAPTAATAHPARWKARP